MTRKHYLAIARVLKDQLDVSTSREQMETVTQIARNLAWTFSQENGNFRIDRFYAECGVGPEGHAAWTEREVTRWFASMEED